MTGGGREATVVAAGGDHIAEVGGFAGGDPCRKLGVEVTGGEAGGLDGVADGVYLVVGRRHQGDGAAVLVVVDPRGGEAVEMLLERAGNDAVVRLVGVKRAWITASQLQGRGCFPAVGEAVEVFQCFDAAVGAEFGDESAAADALELAGIADEGEPPAVPVGEGDELVEGGCREHAGFVDDECRAGRKLELGQWWPVGALPFVKQLGDGVGGDAGVALDRSGRLRGRRDREHERPCA